MGTFTIRNATPQDTGLIYGFILKMARYEKLESEVDTSEVVSGEEDGIPVGFALFFHNFSTFRGQRGLYLEDLFVDREHRGKGYGKALLLHLTRIAVQRQCRRMEWAVLDWNAPSIAFYKSLGAVPMDEWTVFRLTEEQLHQLAQQTL